jgi:hypothetical protein
MNFGGATLDVFGWVPSDKAAPVWVYILMEK